MILVRFRDRFHEPDNEANRYLFRYLDSSIFPADGRFCEVFNLWVDKAYRRRGIATQLKQCAEAETRRRGIQMIYTHTMASNRHVLELNDKLGYQAVRTGPLWDQTPRTSLVKWLDHIEEGRQDVL
jgi:ribosomal protein S18 acetylase RimI-like enzyme